MCTYTLIKKKCTEIDQISGGRSRLFIDWGDASPVPSPLSTPMMVQYPLIERAESGFNKKSYRPEFIKYFIMQLFFFHDKSIDLCRLESNNIFVIGSCKIQSIVPIDSSCEVDIRPPMIQKHLHYYSSFFQKAIRSKCPAQRSSYSRDVKSC